MREANKRTKPLEHREALGRHTLLRTTARGYRPPWAPPLASCETPSHLRRNNLGWQVPRVGLALGCQVGSIMPFCLGEFLPRGTCGVSGEAQQ